MGLETLPLSFQQEFLRRLPGVDRVLQEIDLEQLTKEIPRAMIVGTVQDLINRKRSLILSISTREELKTLDITTTTLAGEVLELIEGKRAANLQVVLNATGVLLHTNLGRAPLARTAVEALQKVGSSFSNLEISLKTGKRSSRYSHVEGLLCNLTGAEAALVVNNNAGAVFLALNTLASGREAIVSRGELVEIGGSFRLPEVMSQSGVKLVEIGTTNKCFLDDYRQAINERTALLLKVHTSNYKILGFTAAVSSKKIVKLAAKTGLPVMEDLGSGLLIDLTCFGLPYEPLVQDSIAAGVDIVTFSGDKLLGGPQAGIIVGKQKFIDKIKKNQLLRILRVDKFTLSALEATLQLYLDPEKALQEIPVFKLLTVPFDSLQARAERLLSRLEENIGLEYKAGIAHEKARVGGGSLPLVSLPSVQITLEHPQINSGEIAKQLRRATPPVMARVRKNKVLLDLRSLRAEEDELMLKVLLDILQ